MKIYTKTGDSGDTSLYGGSRVRKHSDRINAFGAVDELNAQIGAARSFEPNNEIDVFLEKIQKQLFVLGADLAAPDGKSTNQRIGQNHIKFLEETIDAVDSRLEPLKSFVLPAGSQAGSQLHVARTICRRAERLVDKLASSEKTGEHTLVYLNRLSDLLFVLARYENKLSGIKEIKWDGSVET